MNGGCYDVPNEYFRRVAARGFDRTRGWVRPVRGKWLCVAASRAVCQQTTFLNGGSGAGEAGGVGAKNLGVGPSGEDFSAGRKA